MPSILTFHLLFARSPPPVPPPAQKSPPKLPRRTFLTSLITLPLLSSNYDNYAPTYDNLDGINPLTSLLGFTRLRRRVMSQAHGSVLETGVGTGINLPFYSLSNISSLTALDVSPAMLQLANKRVTSLPIGRRTRFIQASVENSGLDTDSFDTVIDTFSLCVYPRPVEALLEMKRVVKNGGRVLLLEHTKSTNELLAAYQDLTADVTAAMSKGCYPNQDVHRMARDVGFHILACEYHVGGSVIFLELGV